jgi:hypothetical protein
MKDTIEFQPNAGKLKDILHLMIFYLLGSFFLPSSSTMEFYFSNFVHLLLKEHSFSHLTQAHSSQLQINFDRFHSATIGSGSFNDFHQLDESQFRLTFSNFQDLIIEHMLFYVVTQCKLKFPHMKKNEIFFCILVKSSIVFSLYNMTNDLCLPSQTFGQLKQDYNSTFQFEVDYGKNILFTSHTFFNISQLAQSKLSIFITNSFDVYFTKQSITSFHQQEQSLLDIWIKYGRNLIFQDNSIENMDIQRSSIMRIGYQYSYGILQMESNAFVNINEGNFRINNKFS